jgi:hypothetical protein
MPVSIGMRNGHYGISPMQKNSFVRDGRLRFIRYGSPFLIVALTTQTAYQQQAYDFVECQVHFTIRFVFFIFDVHS